MLKRFKEIISNTFSFLIKHKISTTIITISFVLTCVVVVYAGFSCRILTYHWGHNSGYLRKSLDVYVPINYDGNYDNWTWFSYESFAYPDGIPGIYQENPAQEFYILNEYGQIIGKDRLDSTDWTDSEGRIRVIRDSQNNSRYWQYGVNWHYRWDTSKISGLKRAEVPALYTFYRAAGEEMPNHDQSLDVFFHVGLDFEVLNEEEGAYEPVNAFVIPLNDDDDEGNQDIDGNDIPDNEPDATNGHRIIAADDELVDAQIVIPGLEGARASVSGNWRLIYPEDRIKIYLDEGGTSFPLIPSNTWSESVGNILLSVEHIDYLIPIIIERIADTEEGEEDIEIKARFIPKWDNSEPGPYDYEGTNVEVSVSDGCDDLPEDLQKADINEDCCVNKNDLAIVLKALGRRKGAPDVGSNFNADANGDGNVDKADIVYVSQRMGNCDHSYPRGKGNSKSNKK